VTAVPHRSDGRRVNVAEAVGAATAVPATTAPDGRRPGEGRLVEYRSGAP